MTFLLERSIIIRLDALSSSWAGDGRAFPKKALTVGQSKTEAGTGRIIPPERNTNRKTGVFSGITSHVSTIRLAQPIFARDWAVLSKTEACILLGLIDDDGTGYGHSTRVTSHLQN